MKIAYLSNGWHVYDHRFLRKMVERGYKLYLISYWPAKVEFGMDGVEFIHYDARFPRLPRIVMHLKRTLQRINPDVLHAGFVQSDGFYSALSRFHPSLLMPWGSDILIYPDESLWYRMITKYTINHADMITCDCELVKNKIIQLTGYPADKIVIFPWGIDLNTFKPANSTSEIRKQLGWRNNKILIMTRQFTETLYGFDYFINALPEIIREMPDTRIIFVGSGPLKTHYEEKINRMELDRYVYFTGEVNDQKMAECINAADIYVTTSLSDGTSCSLLEAMACQLPVIVSDAPAYFEWVKDGVNGYIVPRKNSTTLAQKIIKLLKKPQLRNKMGDLNYQIAHKRADWDKNFNKLEEIYRRLIKQKEA